eukprot:gb/GECG01006872.1/.p1 GENE.gb/GECG01006872.1/~~gb/GECG01006872.1/.p1  ORF type:complete len:668 (+),score=84.23 gb/GECG01006872.1/:1-2004(+)
MSAESDLHEKDARSHVAAMEGSHLYQPGLWFSSTTQALINRTRSNVDAYKAAVKEYEEKEEQRQRMLQDPQYELPPAIQGKTYDPKLGYWLQHKHSDTNSSTQTSYASAVASETETEQSHREDVATTQRRPAQAALANDSSISFTPAATHESYPAQSSSVQLSKSGRRNCSLPETSVSASTTDSSVSRNSTELVRFSTSSHDLNEREQSSNYMWSSLKPAQSKPDFSQAQEAIRKALEQENSIAEEIEKHEEYALSLGRVKDSSRKGRKSRGISTSSSSLNSTVGTQRSRDTIATTTYSDTNNEPLLGTSRTQPFSASGTDVLDSTVTNQRREGRRSGSGKSRGSYDSKAGSAASSEVESLLTSVNDLKKDLLGLRIPTTLDALKRLRDEEARHAEEGVDRRLAESISSRLQNVNRRLSRTLSRRQKYNSVRLSRPRSVTAPKRTFKADRRHAFGRSFSAPPPPRGRERMGMFLDTIWNSSADDSHQGEKQPNSNEYTSGVVIPNPRSVVYEKDVPSTTVNELANAYRRAPIQGCDSPSEEPKKRKFRSKDDRLAAAFNRSFRNRYGFLQSSQFSLHSTGTKAHLTSRRRSSTRTARPSKRKQRVKQRPSQRQNVARSSSKTSSFTQSDLDAMMRSARASVATRSCANSLTRNSLLKNVDMVLSAIS